MRKKIYAVVMIAICLIAASIGIVMRWTYTDVTVGENGMSAFQVAQLTDPLTEMAIEEMRAELEDSSLIIRVKAKGVVDFLFKMFRQEAEVQEVYKGEGIKAGDNIQIIKDSWCIFFDDMSINMGFVNFMEESNEYLLFLEGNVDALYPEDENVYRLEESLITPIFNYEDKEYTVAEMNGETLYVSYEEISRNEFFIGSVAMMEEVISFKHELLKKYTR